MSEEFYEYNDNEDALFENKFTYTAPLLKELYKGMLKWDKRRKINMIMIYILLGINVAMNIVFIIIGNYDLFRLLIVTLVLLAAVAVFRALEPVILSRQVMRSYQKHYNEPMDVYTTFDEDYMTTHDVSLGATQQRALTYDRISSIHESEHFIVLRLDKRQVMSIHKDGFIKGDLASFRTFITRKIKEIEEGWDTSVEVDNVQPGAAAPGEDHTEYESQGQIAQAQEYEDINVASAQGHDDVQTAAGQGYDDVQDAFAGETGEASRPQEGDVDETFESFGRHTKESAEVFDEDMGPVHRRDDAGYPQASEEDFGDPGTFGRGVETTADVEADDFAASGREAGGRRSPGTSEATVSGDGFETIDDADDFVERPAKKKRSYAPGSIASKVKGLNAGNDADAE